MGRYIQQANSKYYSENRMKLKALRAIKKAKAEGNGYFIVKNVISSSDAGVCVLKKPPDTNMVNLQGNRRSWDRSGHKHFTAFVRSMPFQPPTSTGVVALSKERQQNFGDFYKFIAEGLGMGKTYCISEHDRLVTHKEWLQVISNHTFCLLIHTVTHIFIH